MLTGVFSDEHGDFPAGSYVRNPPGTRHAPHTGPGCTIFVKLRQMLPTDDHAVVIATNTGSWQPGLTAGHEVLPLHADAVTGEQVAIERMAAGVRLPVASCDAGEEILVLDGELGDEHGSYPAATWIRNPPGFARRLASTAGARYWVKRGHLAGMVR